MRRWLILSDYHWTALVVVLGLSAALAAWISVGLINVAMANYDFVTHYGLMALRDGAFLQMLEIGGKAGLALGAYMVFKAVETELIYRWRSAEK